MSRQLCRLGKFRKFEFAPVFYLFSSKWIWYIWSTFPIIWALFFSALLDHSRHVWIINVQPYKSNQVKLWSSQLWAQFLQLRREAWKIQAFNGVWIRDLAIPVRCSNQLSYEATDVGSWSFVGSNGPVRNESMTKWYMKLIIYEIKHIWTAVHIWLISYTISSLTRAIT